MRKFGTVDASLSFSTPLFHSSTLLMCTSPPSWTPSGALTTSALSEPIIDPFLSNFRLLRFLAVIDN